MPNKSTKAGQIATPAAARYKIAAITQPPPKAAPSVLFQPLTPAKLTTVKNNKTPAVANKITEQRLTSPANFVKPLTFKNGNKTPAIKPKRPTRAKIHANNADEELCPLKIVTSE